MRSKLWIATVSSVVLLSGCDVPTGDFCDIANHLYFNTSQTVDWLAENDEALLRGIVIHNEKAAGCPNAG